MNLEAFAQKANLAELAEIERYELLCFFRYATEGHTESDLASLIEVAVGLHFARPNPSRLKEKIRESRRFVKATNNGFVKLHANAIADRRAQFPELFVRSEDIVTSDQIIPMSLYAQAPHYIRRLADQVNSTFENNLFDACAVIMRRLLEVLLIQTYQTLGQEASISSQDGTYRNLEQIVANAKTNSNLRLSRNTKTKLDDYRNLGNFAAHRIEYSTRRADIEKLAFDYRGTFEELMTKAGHTK